MLPSACEFHGGIGVQLREGGQLLQFRFGAAAFRGHADGVGDGDEELHFVPRELRGLVV
jgi:hypothetical protein